MSNKKRASFTSLPRFIREARDELKKVAWPDRQTTVRYTVIVVVASLGMGLVIGMFDLLFAKLLEKIII